MCTHALSSNGPCSPSIERRWGCKKRMSLNVNTGVVGIFYVYVTMRNFLSIKPSGYTNKGICCSNIAPRAIASNPPSLASQSMDQLQLFEAGFYISRLCQVRRRPVLGWSCISS